MQIDEIEEDEINEGEIKRWLQNDFRKTTQALEEDDRSKIILSSIDGWLIELLKKTAEEERLKSLTSLR